MVAGLSTGSNPPNTLSSARLDADGNRETVILNIINAFSNLYKSRATITIVRKTWNNQSAGERFFQYGKKWFTGETIFESKLQSSNMELALLDAESNWKLAGVNMSLMLGLPEIPCCSPILSALNQ
jgi:hypothetical protein